jgi:aminopeptidase N
MRPGLRVLFSWLLCWGGFLGLTLPSNVQAADPPSPPAFRLPADAAAPTRYSVEFTVAPDQDTFSGVVDIDLKFKKATSVLWLNAEKLQVKEASLEAGGQTVAARIIPTPKDFVGFQFSHAAGPGPARLHAVFQGMISRKDFQGIFQVKDGGQWYVYSQFENIAARRALPCFDEPGYKVPWQISLRVPKDLSALSNTPQVSEEDSADGMKAVKFGETPPLPSYLVAIAVGHFEFVDAGTTGQKHTHVRIVVPQGRAGEAKYAAETTPHIVDLLEKYFSIPYPYQKLDEVAIPLAGYAMEHPGLVTYGASLILAKPAEDTADRRHDWVSVAAHELAHQWFGDLVTTAWWDDIWLNEGFASWMANKIVNEYHPEWHMNISELNGYQGAMENDSLVSAREVRQPVKSDDDIANAFDSITYSKGSALLNMFESYMGQEEFRQGVHGYLEEYSWKNATSAEFLKALAGKRKEVAAAFSSFLDQAGVPLLTVRLECSGSPALALAQQRFLPLGSRGSAHEQWGIPVCASYPAAAGQGRDCMLLDRPSARLPLSKAQSCPAWVNANPGAVGYYRTLYKGNLLESLLADDARVLSPIEKVAMIGDMAALVDAGRMPLGQALGRIPTLAEDSTRQVVAKTLDILHGLQDNLVEPRLLARYRQYLEDVYGPRARALGWKAKPGDSEDSRILRPAILPLMADVAEDPEDIEEARKLAGAWLLDHKAVDPEMVGAVLVVAARHGDQNLFDRYRAAAKKEKDENIERDLLYAMGSFPQPEIAKEALSLVLTPEIDSRLALYIPFSVAARPETRDLAYDFVKDHWDALIAKLPTDTGADLPYIAADYCDEGHREDAAKFFQGRSTKYAGGPRTLDQVLEQIHLCAAYKKAQEPSVTQFLENYTSTGAKEAITR